MNLTLNIKFGCSNRRASHEGVLCAVSKVNVPDAQSVRELFAASLASVRRPDLYAILQPFVCDSLIVNVHFKCDCVFLLSVQVLQHCCDQNSWKTTKLMVSSPKLSGA